MKRYKVPANKSLGIRVGLEVVGILILVYPMIHIYLILQGIEQSFRSRFFPILINSAGDMEPVKRGFYCDDESIKHPIVEEEISVSEAFIIWACITLLIVPAIEVLHLYVFNDTGVQQPRVCNIPWIIIELYRMLGYCLLGGLCSLLTTEVGDKLVQINL